MQKTYKSTISPIIITIAALALGGIIITMIIIKDWIGFAVVAIPAVFVVHLLLTTYYTINGKQLHVRCGFLINTKIDINTITKIVPTNSILSSPALSFNRIEIFYNRFDSIVISPGDNAAFIADLKEINNLIVVS